MTDMNEHKAKVLYDELLPIVQNFINSKIKVFCDYNNIVCKFTSEYFRYSDSNEYCIYYEYTGDDLDFGIRMQYQPASNKMIEIETYLSFNVLELEYMLNQPHRKSNIHNTLSDTMNEVYNKLIKSLQEYIDRASKLRIP